MFTYGFFSHRKPLAASLQENGEMPGLFGSLSPPNHAPVSPKTPNENGDVILEKNIEKKNDLSFEDEAVVKIQSMFSCNSPLIHTVTCNTMYINEWPLIA